MTESPPTDQAVPVPVDAQLFRVADAVCAEHDLIAPVPIYAAQSGDVVVHDGSKVGTYLGGGMMRRQSGSPE